MPNPLSVAALRCPADGWDGSSSSITGRRSSQGIGHGSDNRRDFLVLPYTDHVPASCYECLIVAFVSLAVLLELASPPFSVRSRSSGMEGAAVPVAAVNEQRDELSWKNDIRAALQASHGLNVHPKAQARPMECRSNAHLRRGVSTAIRLHATTNAWR